MVAFAADGNHIAAAQGLLSKIENVILFPLLTLMMSVAFLVFLWGAYEFVANAAEEGARTEGKKHMLYGIIGLLVMLSAYAILKIAAGTIGCDFETAGGCGSIWGN